MNKLFKLATTVAACITFNPSLALTQSTTLQQQWIDFGFVQLEFYHYNNQTRKQEQLTSTAIYVEVIQNTVKVYNVTVPNPMEMGGCGGFGCDMKKINLVNIIEFKPSGTNKFIITKATNSANYLLSSSCTLNGLRDRVGGEPIPLVCNTAPNSSWSGYNVMFSHGT